jgi:hypothetical protein
MHMQQLTHAHSLMLHGEAETVADASTDARGREQLADRRLEARRCMRAGGGCVSGNRDTVCACATSTVISAALTPPPEANVEFAHSWVQKNGAKV